MINDNTIGYNVSIILKGFNSNKPINAKVDTGADMNSMHANNVKLKSNTVEFDFGDRHIAMPLSGTQSVKTADGGIENRPVVKFTVEVPKEGTDKDVIINNMEFTLNDRSNMDDKILLGLNFIEGGKFTISSEAKEPKNIVEDNDEILDNLLPEMSISSNKQEVINNIIELIESNSILLDDLILIKRKIK